jgi:Lon protease-like protein
MADDSIIPLFPLHTVLFPGGPLPLRIFETRYTDMVGRCMREQLPFGVLMIEEGAEAGDVATTAAVGCGARIVDFGTLSDGLLGISCIGERRFRVQRVWREPDGLNVGAVEWIAPEAALALPQAYARLAATVRRALDELEEPYRHVARHYDDAAWVGNRLAELLPIELADKQALLELEDPLARLEALATTVPDALTGTVPDS